MTDSGYSFIIAKWSLDKDEICNIRSQIFEDGSSLTRHWLDDGHDADAYHLLVYDANSRIIGTARMQPDGCINYVAVLRPWRGNTVGSALLSYLRHIAQAIKLESIWSNVPRTIEHFYTRNGFTSIGEEFLEYNTSLIRMVRRVEPPGKSDASIH